MTPPIRYWRLHHPEYSSDYASTFINGELDHPFSLPGVKCERCGETWGGQAILPYELPAHLRSLKHLTEGWPISGQAHTELRSTVLDALRAAGAPITELGVDATFQPAYLDVPSRPEADFLWSGLSSVVVSKRISDAIIQAGISGCVFAPVIPRKIGKRKARLPPPIPSTGEPEDLISELKEMLDPSEVPPYHELVITAESKHPPGAEPQTKCDLCGRETYDRSARQLVMEPSMWNGHDIFFLATTLWIIVTDSTKHLLQALRPTNVVFLPMKRAA